MQNEGTLRQQYTFIFAVTVSDPEFEDGYTKFEFEGIINFIEYDPLVLEFKLFFPKYNSISLKNITDHYASSKTLEKKLIDKTLKEYNFFSDIEFVFQYARLEVEDNGLLFEHNKVIKSYPKSSIIKTEFYNIKKQHIPEDGISPFVKPINTPIQW